MAVGSDIIAFDVPGHNGVFNLVQEGLFAGHVSVLLSHPDGGNCFTNLVPLTEDCFMSTGRGTITLDVDDTTCADGIELDLASAFGAAVVELPAPPYTAGETIHTEMVQMELSADGGALGPITLRERDDVTSPGEVQNVVVDDATGGFVSGDSFFDVFIEVELTETGTTLNTGDTPFRLDAGTITELPPLSSDYFPPPSSAPVPLFTEGTTDQVGWFCHAQHTPTEVVPCE